MNCTRMRVRMSSDVEQRRAAELHEAPVTGAEEAVTSEAEANTTAADRR